MPDLDNGRGDDPEQWEARHGLSTRERLRRDEGYADSLLEQQKDKELEKDQPMMLDEKGNRSIFDDVDD